VEAGQFNVITKLSDLGFNGALADAQAFDSAPVLADYKWQFSDEHAHEIKFNNYVK